MKLRDIIDFNTFPIDDAEFRAACKKEFDHTGVFLMPRFVQKQAIDAVRDEGLANKEKVFKSTKQHNVYLTHKDESFPDDHARNRLVTSSKGCITDDLMPQNSALRTLYNAPVFRSFLCDVLGEEAMHEYADPLSSINLHFAEKGEELGWHFDNSSFAITLMVQAPEKGGTFEYVNAVRDADVGEMGFDKVDEILDGKKPVEAVSVEAGTLVFFRGRNSIHRVAPNEGDLTRILAVLAYNAEPGIELSEAARMTFYGRLN
ncbi:2OG-Fe(II) oxygenase [uncultured Ruegeria sp.]|uniref:HalD/BesD family halogenase n=1 Tax=uncultured Ruegeria sp. TaxID=259304 RepID=UPI00261CCFEB|nr:2OG-Fe(II) oxygenase [uncultured Ruegeria sp.]